MSDKLKAYWSKRERDLMLDWPAVEGGRSDARFLNSVFDKAFTDELTKRGYDVTTLRFSIGRLPTPSAAPAAESE